MSFDFVYDFFKLIGYVVVDGGWVDGNRFLHEKPNAENNFTAYFP